MRSKAMLIYNCQIWRNEEDARNIKKSDADIKRKLILGAGAFSFYMPHDFKNVSRTRLHI